MLSACLTGSREHRALRRYQRLRRFVGPSGWVEIVMNTSEAKPLTDLVSPGDTLMVATKSHEFVSSRPLTAARIEGDQIFILIDTSASWMQLLKSGDPVHVSVSDTRQNAWISITGTASLSDSEPLIDSL